MLPRVVARKGPPPPGPNAKEDDKRGEEIGTKKSNEDFRNLLLKKT